MSNEKPQELFNWRDYIAISREDIKAALPASEYRLIEKEMDQIEVKGENRELVEAAISQIAQTSEGQDIIRTMAGKESGKIFVITDSRRVSGYMDLAGYGTITMNLDEIGELRYRGLDGAMHEFSLPRFVVHELRHAERSSLIVKAEDVYSELYDRYATHGYHADNDFPHLGQFERPKSFLELKEAVEELIEAGVITNRDIALVTYDLKKVPEIDAVKYANEFMAKYYGEEPRGHYLDTDNAGELSAKVYDRITHNRDQLLPTVDDPCPNVDISALKGVCEAGEATRHVDDAREPNSERELK